MTEPTGTEPVRIIDLLELARCQEWGEINGIITVFDTGRLRRLKNFLVERLVEGKYRANGYQPWERAMEDLKLRVDSLIHARKTRDDWQTLETAVI